MPYLIFYRSAFCYDAETVKVLAPPPSPKQTKREKRSPIIHLLTKKLLFSIKLLSTDYLF